MSIQQPSSMLLTLHYTIDTYTHATCVLLFYSICGNVLVCMYIIFDFLSMHPTMRYNPGSHTNPTCNENTTCRAWCAAQDPHNHACAASFDEVPDYKKPTDKAHFHAYVWVSSIVISSFLCLLLCPLRTTGSSVFPFQSYVSDVDSTLTSR